MLRPKPKKPNQQLNTMSPQLQTSDMSFKMTPQAKKTLRSRFPKDDKYFADKTINFAEKTSGNFMIAKPKPVTIKSGFDSGKKALDSHITFPGTKGNAVNEGHAYWSDSSVYKGGKKLNLGRGTDAYKNPFLEKIGKKADKITDKFYGYNQPVEDINPEDIDAFIEESETLMERANQFDETKRSDKPEIRFIEENMTDEALSNPKNLDKVTDAVIAEFIKAGKIPYGEWNPKQNSFEEWVTLWDQDGLDEYLLADKKVFSPYMKQRLLQLDDTIDDFIETLIGKWIRYQAQKHNQKLPPNYRGL